MSKEEAIERLKKESENVGKELTKVLESFKLSGIENIRIKRAKFGLDISKVQYDLSFTVYTLLDCLYNNTPFMNFDNDLNNSIKAFFEIIKDEHDKLEEVEKEPFIDETFMGIQMTISNVIGKIVQEKYSDLFTN